MLEEITFLITGIIFGLSAGIVPGPLLTLVVSETLKYSKIEGMKVAIAPLITDAPIILISVFILSAFSKVNFLLGLISLLGAIFILYLAFENLKIKGFEVDIENVKPQSLKKGIITNLLNPHPYLFYFSVGGPIIIKALGVNVISAVLFLLGFIGLLVGSKVIIAQFVGKSRTFLKSNMYVYTIKILGIILLIFALLFIKDGLKFFGII